MVAMTALTSGRGRCLAGRLGGCRPATAEGWRTLPATVPKAIDGSPSKGNAVNSVRDRPYDRTHRGLHLHICSPLRACNLF